MIANVDAFPGLSYAWNTTNVCTNTDIYLSTYRTSRDNRGKRSLFRERDSYRISAIGSLSGELRRIFRQLISHSSQFCELLEPWVNLSSGYVNSDKYENV